MKVSGENKMGNGPVKRFNDRLLSVCIWKNKGTDRYGQENEFHTVSISRGYKDKDGNFKSSNSLRPEDLSSVRDLLEQAENYLNGDSEEIEEEPIEILE